MFLRDLKEMCKVQLLGGICLRSYSILFDCTGKNTRAFRSLLPQKVRSTVRWQAHILTIACKEVVPKDRLLPQLAFPAFAFCSVHLPAASRPAALLLFEIIVNCYVRVGVKTPNPLPLPVSMVKPKKERSGQETRFSEALAMGSWRWNCERKVTFLGYQYRWHKGRMSWWRD